MAPPTTPIMKTPDAADVYLPSRATERVKIAPHMMEWNRPTATRIQGLSTSTARITRTEAATVVTVSCVRGLILLRELPTARPMSIPPQYRVARRAGDERPLSMAYMLMFAPMQTSTPT